MLPVELADLLSRTRGRFLAEYCRAEGVPHLPFDDFREIQETLESLLEEYTTTTL